VLTHRQFLCCKTCLVLCCCELDAEASERTRRGSTRKQGLCTDGKVTVTGCVTWRQCPGVHRDAELTAGCCSETLASPPGEGLRTIELSLEDLKTKFRGHTVSATLQCTGNRRHEINEVRPVQVCFGL
jgi:hypothetical protein